MTDESDSPFDYPIDGALDLHQFAPDETKEVLEEYLDQCLERGIYQLRIVHGKGTGVQRKIVRSFLSKHPKVESFKHESGSGGGWGATVVDLKRGD